MKSKYLIHAGLFVVALSLLLAACGQASSATPCPTAVPCPSCPTCPTPAPCSNCPSPVVKEAPFQTQWANSPHNNAKALAFTYWNNSNPANIPPTCAKCHSTPGYQDFIGADGSAAGAMESGAPINTTITCLACHNDATLKLTGVVFLSGIEINGLGQEAICMTCHQGLASKVQVDEVISKVAAANEDMVSPDLAFINVHYRAAAATLYGGLAKGGYEYDGKIYDIKFAHVDGYATCTGCHDPHSLEVKTSECAACHKGVASQEDLKQIRMSGSAKDYNGNGDTTEGISAEISGLQVMLMTAIQTYGKEVSKTAIVYDENSYPYYFIDTNTDGKFEKEEGTSQNMYTSWTGRLLKAAYNYQFSLKDPGAYAHNAKYIIELLYDSIADLNTQLATPVDLSKASRNDAGHFNGSSAAYRHWDAQGEVAGGCARCHAAEGLPQFIKENVNIAAPLPDGMKCANCHDDLTSFTPRAVKNVTFPSGAVLSFGDNNDANLCILCHQGLLSKAGIDKAVKGLEADTVTDKLSFKNPHYFAAGATLFGAEAQGPYLYDGQTYAGPHKHISMGQSCITCHDAHALTIKIEACAACHPKVKSEADLANIRMIAGDFNGNGNASEGMAGEVAGMQQSLYVAIQKYAAGKTKVDIVYDANAYPYFFGDTNGNGKVDLDEKAYAAWTPRLLEAAYNYQWVQKDPGAFAHNGKFILQILFDSIKDLGGDVSKMTRPETAKP